MAGKKEQRKKERKERKRDKARKKSRNEEDSKEKFFETHCIYIGPLIHISSPPGRVLG